MVKPLGPETNPSYRYEFRQTKCVDCGHPISAVTVTALADAIYDHDKYAHGSEGGISCSVAPS